MALFDPQIPSASADVVAILEAETGRQVFSGARPMKVAVSESAKLLSHPLENGAIIIDHRLILPVGLSVSMILEAERYRDTYQEIRQLFRTSTRLAVQTKTETYTNLYLQDIPHEEDPALFDTIAIILEFIEAQFARVQVLDLPPASVAAANDSSTNEQGEQTTETVTDQSAIQELRGKLRDFFEGE